MVSSYISRKKTWAVIARLSQGGDPCGRSAILCIIRKNSLSERGARKGRERNRGWGRRGGYSIEMLYGKSDRQDR